MDGWPHAGEIIAYRPMRDGAASFETTRTQAMLKYLLGRSGRQVEYQILNPSGDESCTDRPSPQRSAARLEEAAIPRRRAQRPLC